MWHCLAQSVQTIIKKEIEGEPKKGKTRTPLNDYTEGGTLEGGKECVIIYYKPVLAPMCV